MSEELSSKEESLCKTVTYRTMSIMITYLVAFMLTYNHGISFTLTVISQVVKTLMYYLHERLWSSNKKETLKRLPFKT